ncbi:hypothetical protein SHIRM173S_06407 [Streptomyces hirsutus]
MTARRTAFSMAGLNVAEAGRQLIVAMTSGARKGCERRNPSRGARCQDSRSAAVT